VLTVAQRALDDLGDPEAAQDALVQPIQQRSEAGDGNHQRETAGPQNAPRFRQGSNALGPLRQMVERPEEQCGIA
jgi:hypothetical protein